ncbi:MAG TPA: BCAM0308 family protein [Candidatus Binatia bacterium]|nr:BCAM0308 family protein [Candidatus Binatia bacterium]
MLAESRKDRLIHERNHDPYKTTRKPGGSTVCPVCNAVFKDGHWQWLDSWPLTAPREICQACQRIRDNYPAGSITMTGGFARTHKLEVLNLARNKEQGERARHPLHRIMRIEERPDATVVTTTDIHLPKRIGQALQRAYKGSLDINYDVEGCFVRVRWTSHEDKNHRPVAKKRRKL